MHCTSILPFYFCKMHIENGFRLYFCKGDEKCCSIHENFIYNMCNFIILHCKGAQTTLKRKPSNREQAHRRYDSLGTSSSKYFVILFCWYKSVGNGLLLSSEGDTKICLCFKNTIIRSFFLIPKFNTKLNEIQSIKINQSTLAFLFIFFYFWWMHFANLFTNTTV